jgi:hypothetical protein
MTNPNPDDFPEVSKRFVRDVVAMPDPPAEVFKHYAYFIEGVRDHLEKLAGSPDGVPGRAPARSLAEVIHAVFTTAGRLLQTAADGVQEILAPPQPAFGTRGLKGLGHDALAGTPADSLLSGITVAAADATIRMEWHRQQAGPVIEVGVLDPNGAPVRPLEIAVTDDKGEALIQPLHVSAIATNPRFPQPAAGVYVFHITWPTGSQQVRIEVSPA